MSKLYEISERYNNIVDLLDNEEIDTKLLAEALREVDEDFNTKAENIIKIIKQLESDSEVAANEAKRLNAKSKSDANKAENLKAYLKVNMLMLGKNKVETPLFKAFIRRSESIKIINEDLIPDNLKITTTTVKVDKRAIMAAYKAGEEVPGAGISVNENINIK